MPPVSNSTGYTGRTQGGACVAQRALDEFSRRGAAVQYPVLRISEMAWAM